MANLLSNVVKAVQGSLRMRVEGRSSAPGSVPEWLRKSTPLRTSIKPGSTVLSISSPPLFEANPELFGQTQLFDGDINPTVSAFDLFHQSLEASLTDSVNDDVSRSFDAPLLQTFVELGTTLKADVETMSIISPAEAGPQVNGRSTRLTNEAIETLRKSRDKIPPPSRSTIVGVLTRFVATISNLPSSPRVERWLKGLPNNLHVRHCKNCGVSWCWRREC